MIRAMNRLVRNSGFIENGAELGADALVGPLPKRAKWITIRVAGLGDRFLFETLRALMRQEHMAVRASHEAVPIPGAALRAVQHDCKCTATLALASHARSESF